MSPQNDKRDQIVELVKTDSALKGTIIDTLLTTFATFSVDQYEELMDDEVAPEEVELGTVNDFEMALRVMMQQLGDNQEVIYNSLTPENQTEVMLKAKLLSDQHEALGKLFWANATSRLSTAHADDFSGLGLRKNGIIAGVPKSDMTSKLLSALFSDGCGECDACLARKEEAE